MTALRIGQHPRSVRNRGLDHDTLLSELKHLIANMFRIDISDPDKIADDELLAGGSLGLNRPDTLELALCIEEGFGIRICSLEETHHAFASIASLADFIHTHVKTNRTRSRHPPAAQIFRPGLTSPSLAWDELPAAVGP